MIRRARPSALRIEALPPDYDPGFPPRLSRQEFDALLASPLCDRIRRVALAAAALGIGGCDGVHEEGRTQMTSTRPVDARSERESAVLRVLAKVRGPSTWFWRSTFQSESPRPSPVLPLTPISFGNSYSGLFDEGVAKNLAAELFTAYGFIPERDVLRTFANGESAVLDVFDRRRGVACELRRLAAVENPVLAGAEVAAEPGAQALSDGERRELETTGVSVLVCEHRNYAVNDGDVVTPNLAYLASVVDFLNFVSDGPQVDLSQLLGSRFATLPLAREISAQDSIGADVGPRRIVFRYQGGPATIEERASRRATPDPTTAQIPSTAGRPGAASLDVTPEDYMQHLVRQARGEATPDPRVTLIQRRPNRASIEVEATGGFLIVPSTFDASLPFDVVLDLPAGTWRVDPRLRVALSR
jgi:hypothetical protein